MMLRCPQSLHNNGYLTVHWFVAFTIFWAATVLATSARADLADDAFEDRVRAYLLSNPEIILEALDVLSERQAQQARAAKLEAYPDLFSGQSVLGMGPSDAPIRVIEFFDYRCAPCKALHPRLVAALADHPQIRVEMRQLPILSPGSERGARFALAVKQIAGPAAYKAVHDELWGLRGPLNSQSFRRVSAEIGLDWPSVEAAMSSGAVSDQIGANRDLAIDLEILGTPAFVTPTSVSFGNTDADDLVKTWLAGLDVSR